MAPYLDHMKQNLALDLDTEMSRLNIKATTTEKLGFPGREEGIAVHAVVLLETLK
jgi:2-C-methyl-D-erythritol 2,4-cyclodiphosphate synthase